MNVDDVMRNVKVSVDTESELKFRVLTFKVARDIIKNTPQDEGTARSSWNISKRRADLSSNPTEKNRSVSLDEVPMNKKLQPYFISSPLPYMQRLEFGHSDQATGFIRAALARFKLI